MSKYEWLVWKILSILGRQLAKIDMQFKSI